MDGSSMPGNPMMAMQSAAADASGGGVNCVMQAMMAQQMQFQNQMREEAELESKKSQPVVRDTHKSSPTTQNWRPETWPLTLEAHQELKEKLITFMDKFNFENR